MIVLEALFPICFLLLLGIFLRRGGFTDGAFLKKADSLVYTIFFPLMLFYKIGGSRFDRGLPFDLLLACLVAFVFVFAAALIFSRAVGMPASKIGSFIQSCYRFNTYIGVAVIMNSLGDEGVALFGFIIGIIIPLVNVGAVSTLIWFSPSASDSGRKRKIFVKALLSNPLILGCLAGIVYGLTGFGFPRFIDNTLNLVALLTLPLALLSIGGNLTARGLLEHLPLALIAAGFKLLVLPLAGFFFLSLFDVGAMGMVVGMLFFSLPTSSAIYVLSGQLGSDPQLATASILTSTVLSFVSLTTVFLIFL